MSNPMPPSMTPQEAHYNAQQYYYHAGMLPEGEAKNEALRASQWWSHEANRLYQLTHMPQMVSSAQAPPKTNNVAIIVAVLVPIFLLIVIGGVALVVAGWNSSMRDIASGTSQNGVPTGSIPTYPEPSSTGSAPSTTSTVEEDWRSGFSSIDIPAGVDDGPPSRFSQSFPDASSFVNRESASGINIVYTDDPLYNCGWQDAYDFAGCYSPDYKETIFLWWNDYASDADKQFLAAHELSHYFQWKYKFDLMHSAYVDSTIDYDLWYKTVETDATCRVLSWGGYDRRVANRSSSPCDTDNWSDTWLEDQAAQQGVVVTDW